MQAVLLLAHKGYDYIDEFCNQFSDTTKFNIYIHYDAKLTLSKIQLFELQHKHRNIRHISSSYNSQYFSMSLVDATIHLMKVAIKDDNTYYHLMSEMCKCLYSEEYTYNYFEDNTNEYIEITNYKSTYKELDIENNYLYNGSQWWSLSKHGVQFILDIISTTDFYNKFKNSVESFNSKTSHKIAPDESFFQNLIMNNSNDLHFKSSLRYCEFGRNAVHPFVLNLSHYDKIKDLNDILFVRKYDYKKNGCVQVIKEIRQYKKDHENII